MPTRVMRWSTSVLQNARGVELLVHEQGPAAQQREQADPESEAERDVEHEQSAFAGSEVEQAVDLLQLVVEGLLTHHHALGFARRAGREDHERGVFEKRPDRRRLDGDLQDRRRFRCLHPEAGLRAVDQALRDGGGCVAMHGNGDTVGQPDAQQRHEVARIVGDVEHNRFVGPKPAGPQRPFDRPCGIRERVEGDRLSGTRQGDGRSVERACPQQGRGEGTCHSAECRVTTPQRAAGFDVERGELGGTRMTIDSH